jgi:hypothetical protein
MARRTKAATVVIAFEVAHQTAIAADPGECPLDDPSLWQNDKAVEISRLIISRCHEPVAAATFAIFGPL